MRKIVTWLFLLCAACPGRVMPAPAQQGTLLLFSEYEKEVEPYRTRVIVTEDYMRFDDGEGAPDFILFDRKAGVIFSINSDDRTIMSLRGKSLKVVPPFELKQDARRVDDMQDAPAIAGVKPQHYVLTTNQRHCHDVVAVPGLLPDVLAATRAFNAIVASNNAATLQFLPADQQEPCELSRSIFAFNRHLEFGFPVREWDNRGRGRVLLDFRENVEVDRGLCVLPEGYKRFSIEELREGRVDFNE